MGFFKDLANGTKNFRNPFADHDEDEDSEYYDDEPEEKAPVNPATAVPPRVAASPRGVRPSSSQGRPYTMVVVNPSDFKDAEKIADHVRQGHPVVINIEKTDGAAAQRIIDFVQGAVHVLDGRIDAISETIYLCAPNNTTVSKESFSAYASPAAPGADDVPQWRMPQA